MKDFANGLTTAQAASAVSKALNRPVTGRDVDNGLRTWSVDDLPKVINGRRRWTAADVDRLRETLAAKAVAS